MLKIVQMVVLEDIDDLGDSLKDFISNYDKVAKSLRRLQYRDIDRNLIRRSDEYTKNEKGRFERMKSAYNVFSDAFNQICEKYVNEIASIQEQSNNEMKILQDDIKKMNEELKMKNEKLMKEKQIKFTKCNDIGTITYVAVNNKYGMKSWTTLKADKNIICNQTYSLSKTLIFR